MNAFLARWIAGRASGMRHRMLSWPLALLIVIAAHAGSAYYLARLNFNNAPEVYYPPDSPAVLVRNELRREFPTDEVLTVLFQGDDLYGKAFLTRLQRLVERLEEHPLVDRVLAVTSFERIAGSEDGFRVEHLIEPKQFGTVSPQELQRKVLGDRFAPGRLASRDGRYLAIAIRPKLLTESGQRLTLKVAVAGAINEAGLRPNFAGDAGPVAVDVAILASLLADTATLVPLTVGIGLLLLAWVVGRLRPVIIGGVAMSTVVHPAIAGIVAAGQPYTMASAILPSLLAAYTVATLLHLYAGVQRAQRLTADRSEALDRAIEQTRRPSAYNVLTTAAGLLSLLLVPLPPVQVFALAGAGGALLVFVTVFFLVPPFLRHWDRKPWPQRASGMGLLGRLARRATLSSMRYPKSVIAILAAAVFVAFPYTQRVEAEADLLAFFAPTHPINVETRRIESALAGTTVLELSLRGASRDDFQRVDTLQQIKAFQDWLDKLPEVDLSISMVDLVQEMHWAMNRERPEFRALPPSDRLLRQYLLVYDGDDLYELVNREFDHARIVLNLNVHGTQAIGQTIERIRRKLDVDPIPGVEVDIGGYGRLLSDQLGMLVNGQEKSFLVAFGQIFVILALLWRSTRAAALCMVPNVAPLFFILALMGAMAIRLDSATVMIAGVVLGITVDDTIHLYHGFRERLRRGVAPLWAIVRSYESSGRAVLATSAVLIAQFALMISSDFVPTANFGLMTAVGLLAGLLFEVLLLPALLVLFFGGAWSPRAMLKLRRFHWRWLEGAARPPDASSTMLSSDVGTASGSHVPGMPLARRVLVCHGDICKQARSEMVWRLLREEQASWAEKGRDVSLNLTKTSCLGPCRFAPVIQVYPEDLYYGLLDEERLRHVANEHFVHGRPVTALALPAPMRKPDPESTPPRPPS